MLSTSTGMMAWRDRSQKVCTPVVRIPELGSSQIQGEQDDEHDGKPEGGNGDGHIVQAVGDAVEP